MPIGRDGQWQLLRAAAMTSSKYIRPPESDETVRNRMRDGVLKGTHDRLHGYMPPLGIDPKTGELYKTMPVLKVLPPKHVSEDENNISDLHDYDNLNSHPDAAAARGA